MGIKYKNLSLQVTNKANYSPIPATKCKRSTRYYSKVTLYSGPLCLSRLNPGLFISSAFHLEQNDRICPF